MSSYGRLDLIVLPLFAQEPVLEDQVAVDLLIHLTPHRLLREVEEVKLIPLTQSASQAIL